VPSIAIDAANRIEIAEPVLRTVTGLGDYDGPVAAAPRSVPSNHPDHERNDQVLLAERRSLTADHRLELGDLSGAAPPNSKIIEPHEQFSATSGRSDDGHRNRNPPEL
jgi:hypothetical protein